MPVPESSGEPVTGNPGRAVRAESAVTADDNDLGFGADFAGFEVTVGGPSGFRPKFWALLRRELRPRLRNLSASQMSGQRCILLTSS
jgi:hypothetical protein